MGRKSKLILYNILYNMSDVNDIIRSSQLNPKSVRMNPSKAVYIVVILCMFVGLGYFNLFKLYPLVGNAHEFFWVNFIQQILILVYIVFIHLYSMFYIAIDDPEKSKKRNRVIFIHLFVAVIILITVSLKTVILIDDGTGAPLAITEILNLFFLMIMINFTKMFETDIGFSMFCPKYDEDDKSTYRKYLRFLEEADNGNLDNNNEDFMSRRKKQIALGKFMTTIVFLFIISYHQASIFKIKDYF